MKYLEEAIKNLKPTFTRVDEAQTTAYYFIDKNAEDDWNEILDQSAKDFDDVEAKDEKEKGMTLIGNIFSKRGQRSQEIYELPNGRLVSKPIRSKMYDVLHVKKTALNKYFKTNKAKEINEVATRILNLSPTAKDAVSGAIKFEMNMIGYDMGEDPELERIHNKFMKKGIQGLTDKERERVHDSVEHAIENYNKKYYSNEIRMLKDLVGSIK